MTMRHGARQMPMRTRRALLAGLGAGALVSAVGRATAQAPLQIRISTAAPPADFLAKALDSLKSEIAKSGLGLAIETYPASALFRQGTEVPALQRGTLEMSTMTTFEVAQQIPELGFFNRGYLFRDYPHLRQVFDGPLGVEYRSTVSAKMGIEILATAYLGTRQVNLRQKRQVKQPPDLAGVKMRMPAGPEWLLLGKALGVDPVPLGMPEVYLGLKTGSIDGQENPLSILGAAKLYEVTEQVVLTSHMVQPVFYAMAKPVFDKLTAEQRSGLEGACRASAKANDKGRLADEATIIESLKGRGLSVDAIELGPFRARADETYAAASAAKAWDAAFMQRVAETR